MGDKVPSWMIVLRFPCGLVEVIPLNEISIRTDSTLVKLIATSNPLFHGLYVLPKTTDRARQLTFGVHRFVAVGVLPRIPASKKYWRATGVSFVPSSSR